MSFCNTCHDWLREGLDHQCPPLWLIWCAEDGETVEDAVAVRGHDAEAAARAYAGEHDSNGSYGIANGHEMRISMRLKSDEEGAVTHFSLSGEMAPSYHVATVRHLTLRSVPGESTIAQIAEAFVEEPWKKDEKPQFTHDCPQCVFLGRYQFHPFKGRPLVDLYVCLHPSEGIDTVIARYGDAKLEYASGLVYAVRMLVPELIEALKRALMEGYLVPSYEQRNPGEFKKRFGPFMKKEEAGGA